MIQCPNCGSFRVYEERHAPFPGSQGWRSVLAAVGTVFERLAQDMIREYAASQPGRKAELPPCEYRRTCQACGHRWTWKPGQPQPAQREPSARRAATPAAHISTQQQRSAAQRARVRVYQPFLDELVAHWRGTFEPDPDFTFETALEAHAFFHAYQQALGVILHPKAVYYVSGYVPNYYPQDREILPFVGAHLHLRRGKRKEAAQILRRLCRASPHFADAWLWLSATVDERPGRLALLEEAVRLEPGHLLAADALAMARGDVSTEGEPLVGGDVRVVTVTHCAECGGSLHYDPGADEVVCAYCGAAHSLDRADLLEGTAPLVSRLRLQRMYQDRAWKGVGRVARCRACGARVNLAQYLLRECAFCGTGNLLVTDHELLLEQPDGFVPFDLDEGRATEAVRAAVARDAGRDADQGAGRGAEVARAMHGLYLPYWVFDGVVEVQVRRVRDDGSLSTGPLTHTPWRNLMLPAVAVPLPSLLDQLGPFRSDALVPYEARLLADWPVQLYDLNVEVVAEDAYMTMMALTRRTLGPPPITIATESRPGPSRVRTLQVSQVTYQLVLLPVWAVLLEAEGGRRLALINGQTGKVILGALLPGDAAR